MRSLEAFILETPSSVAVLCDVIISTGHLLENISPHLLKWLPTGFSLIQNEATDPTVAIMNPHVCFFLYFQRRLPADTKASGVNHRLPSSHPCLGLFFPLTATNNSQQSTLLLTWNIWAAPF